MCFAWLGLLILAAGLHRFASQPFFLQGAHVAPKPALDKLMGFRKAKPNKPQAQAGPVGRPGGWAVGYAGRRACGQVHSKAHAVMVHMAGAPQCCWM